MSNRKADNLLLFKSIVDCGSLSTAAKVTNISVSQASKRMTHLEHTLGIQLLHRSTRKLTLTPPGEVLYKKLEQIKEQIDEAWQSMLDYTNDPKGEIKISAPMYFGLNHLVNFTKQFSNDYPEIHVDLNLANTEQSLEESQCDIKFMSHVMGIQELIPNANVYAKKVSSEKLVYVASKEYILKHGKPVQPGELDKHKCLAINTSGNGVKQWRFYTNQTPHNQNISVAFETNNYEALKRAATSGMGIAQIPNGLLNQQNDELVVLFEDYTKDTLDTYAYFSKNKKTSKKISLFLEKLHTP